jgi:hypothetical protein
LLDVKFTGSPEECSDASRKLRDAYPGRVARQSKQKPSNKPGHTARGLVVVFLTVRPEALPEREGAQ